jgi:predicted DNA-binding transcriptional regulator AlpA
MQELDEKAYRYVSDKALAERYEVARQTIWRWVREGRLPAPVKLADGSTRWWLPTVIEHEQKAELCPAGQQPASADKDQERA